jgi:MarR family transcriptional regulator for hemolysin
MEEQGWVERRTDPDDRRSKRLSITVKGRTLKEKAEPVLQRVNRQVEEELPPGRLSETKTLLEELYQNLKDESEQGPPKVYFKDSE